MLEKEFVGSYRQIQHLWGKTGGKENPQMWGALIVHLADTAETARIIWQEWLASSVKSFVCQQTKLCDKDSEALVSWLASVHDIGKATPSFQSKVSDLAEAVASTGLHFDAHCESCSHAFMGEIIVEQWLNARGWDEGPSAGCAAIVGGHHGINPNEEILHQIALRTRINPLSSMGDEEWQNVQNTLLAWAFEGTGASFAETNLLEATIPTCVQIVLTAVVIMADWIASNTDLFPLEESYTGWTHCKERARAAWNSLHLPKRFNAGEPLVDHDALFHKRFSFLPSDATLRPTQSAVAEIASEAHEPTLIIIEESMGGGKTESALLSSEILMHSCGASGIAFLLPTQATSNAMFARVESWMLSLLDDQNDSSVQDLHLLHGKAALNDDYASLPVWHTSWMGDNQKNGEQIVAHQWFSGRKQSLLAPFVVGTVDQLLMAALKTKHVHLRHLGLAGKVVVIDEVHAYDAYMSTYLDRVLFFLGAYGVPVLLLSATLPPRRRAELLNAYRGERKRALRRKSQIPAPRRETGDPCYPLVSFTTSNHASQICYKAIEPSGGGRNIRIDWMDDGDEVLLQELRASLSNGGCACVLRNTVARAQNIYRFLCDNLDVRVVLAHSRFVSVDRAERDAWLSKTLGPKADARPHALVVVATQVLEQSLDIDLDLLITDVAPVDLLLQRMGRLHRHHRGVGESMRPEALRTARCVITGVRSWDADIPEFAKGIGAVYEPAVLMRTICAINERMGQNKRVNLPEDIAPLVENVYEGDAAIPQNWETAYAEAHAKELETLRDKKERASEWLLPKPGRVTLDGWMRNSVRIGTEAQGRAAVRDSEESIEVVVVQEHKGDLKLLPWVAEKFEVDPCLGTLGDTPPDDVARAAALCTVSLPPSMSAPYIADEMIDALCQLNPCIGWEESRWLSGMIPLVINEDGEVTISCAKKQFHLSYTRETGLEII